ncbi:hypothetical protein IH575_00275 [Candidatus Dojkabacteria bacterium]|nr:hypothetical protein [Candidatus Dojkabacteria bacterium]
MKITLLDLYNQKAQEVINKLSESDKTDVLTARMVVRLLNATKSNQQELNTLVEKVNKNPEITKWIEEGSTWEINKLLAEEMQKAEIEVDLTPLSFEQLHEAGLSPKEIFILSWLLTEDKV